MDSKSRRGKGKSAVSHWTLGLGIVIPLSLIGCGGLIVVEESAGSDYALCVEKRESGGVAPEVAAMDCLPVVAGTETENG